MLKTWHTPEILQRTSWRLSETYLKRTRRLSLRGLWRKPVEAEWLNEEVDRHMHVYPVDDFVSHSLHDGDDCICGPDVVFGNDMNLIVHHSLDGREFKDSGFTKYREAW